MTMPDQPYRRIVVLGSSGAGKSTLARVLGDATGLPVVHLDQEHWQPGWTEPDAMVWRARLAELATAPEWIIDGQYGASLNERLTRADLALFLDLPTGICLWRIVERWWRLRGSVRPDMAADCPEKIDLAFLHYVATFRLLQRPKVVAALGASGVRTIWLRSRREQDAFAAAVRANGLETATTSAAAFPARS